MSMFRCCSAAAPAARALASKYRYLLPAVIANRNASLSTRYSSVLVRRITKYHDRYLSDLNDMEMLADLMASTFINDPLRRQQVLEELVLNQRLRLVIQYLGEEIGSAAA
jgi:hypothetical protein